MLNVCNSIYKKQSTCTNPFIQLFSLPIHFLIPVMGLPSLFIKLLLFYLLVFLLICRAEMNQIPRPFTYSVPKNSFNSTIFNTSLAVLGKASFDENHILQVTPDSANNKRSYRLNSSGRVILNRPFKLWEEAEHSSENNTVASFNSIFLVNFYVLPHPGEQAGDGFTFFIAPDLDIPLNSHGEWLGLTNATLNGNPSNKFIAIEFDTKKQPYDIDDNHIGLDINSVQSKINVSLSDFNIQLAPVNDTIIHKVWIEYNGTMKMLEVYMDKENNSKPAHPVLSEHINLKDYVNKHSYFGLSASTGTTAQLNCVLQWELTVQNLDKDKDIGWLKVGIALGAAAVVLLVVLCVIGWFLYKKKKKVCDELNIKNALLKLPGTPKEFQYKDLKQATNNFSQKMKLGQGGYGVVYKGVLAKDNTEVAVKRFSRELTKGIADFLAELTIINRLRHKHLVRLLGWCHKKRTLLLVYEYMPNGSVDNHLFDLSDNLLSWSHRRNILAGLSSALDYLHNNYDQMVVHRDIKSSNILLDSDYNARLGDFGLARALEQGKTSYATAEGVPAGTFGYIAPEIFLAGKATRNSDVFGLGAVVLEVICGRQPWVKVLGSMVLVDWVWKLYREGCILEAVDEKLGTDYVDVEAERLLLLGLACCHPIASERPKAESIVQIISGSVPVPEVPRFKPAFVWDPEDNTTSDTESVSTNTTDSTLSNPTDTMHITLSEKGETGPEYLSREKYVGFVDILIKP